MAKEHFKEQIIPELRRQMLLNPTPLYNGDCKIIGNQSAVSFSSMTPTGTHDLSLEQKNRLLIQSQQQSKQSVKANTCQPHSGTPLYNVEWIENQSAVSSSSMTPTGTHDPDLEQQNRLFIRSRANY